MIAIPIVSIVKIIFIGLSLTEKYKSIPSLSTSTLSLPACPTSILSLPGYWVSLLHPPPSREHLDGLLQSFSLLSSTG